MSDLVHALRDPEAFALRWRESPPVSLLVSLAATAAFGVGLYGAAMHAFQGAGPMVAGAAGACAAAGAAWTATIPALYVLGGLGGSRLSLRAVLLSTLVTVSFSGVSLLASIPVLWLIELCAPWTAVRVLANVVIFGGVGLSMLDVHLRVGAALEGRHLRHFGWLALLGVLGIELFWVAGVWNLA